MPSNYYKRLKRLKAGYAKRKNNRKANLTSTNSSNMTSIMNKSIGKYTDKTKRMVNILRMNVDQIMKMDIDDLINNSASDYLIPQIKNNLADHKYLPLADSSKTGPTIDHYPLFSELLDPLESITTSYTRPFIRPWKTVFDKEFANTPKQPPEQKTDSKIRICDISRENKIFMHRHMLDIYYDEWINSSCAWKNIYFLKKINSDTPNLYKVDKLTNETVYEVCENAKSLDLFIYRIDGRDIDNILPDIRKTHIILTDAEVKMLKYFKQKTLDKALLRKHGMPLCENTYTNIYFLNNK